ncbi:Na/Pi symporter [Peribacillus sp. B-H-3]|uniref:Na/Pi symporter n=1 Tax=Peribacillus sp. B-H-3 TaxID=3400420 RepID=UPI003B011882
MRILLLFSLYIGMFLLGMLVLRKGLFQLSGDKLKEFLSKVTDAPWKGFLSGTIITGILQSSSAVMVMTVGLVSAGSLTFPQTIGIILGTNIGSTATAEFMSFSLDRIIVPGIVLGTMLLFIPKSLTRSLGMAFIGISSIFAAMSGFKMLSSNLTAYPAVNLVLVAMEKNLFLALLIGMALTALIHSGSATIGIAMSFLMGNQLNVDTAIAIMLGSNIGTCITGYMASIGSGKEAAFTAYAHIWLNVIGVLAFFPFIHQLQQAAAYLTDAKETQLAHASVLFNAATSIIVLPFSHHYARFILFLHKPRT